MESNRALVGRVYPPRALEVTPELCAAFARATGDDNPAYFDAAPLAPPMLVVCASIPLGVLPVITDPELIGDTARLLRLLHGEEDIRWHGVVRAGDTLSAEGIVEGIEDKSGGELLTIGTRLRNRLGELVAETHSALMIRGERRGVDIKQLKEELTRREEPPAETFSGSWVVAPDQSQRYAEVSGDWNPIHLDDDIARKAGLKGRILHGLCTMAFAQRVVIDERLGGDPRRLRRLKVRFTKPVYMQDTLTCSGWVLEPGTTSGLGLLVRNQDGVVVLRDAIAEVAAS